MILISIALFLGFVSVLAIAFSAIHQAHPLTVESGRQVLARLTE